MDAMSAAAIGATRDFDFLGVPLIPGVPSRSGGTVADLGVLRLAATFEGIRQPQRALPL